MINQTPAVISIFCIFLIPFYASFALANNTDFHVGAILDFGSPIGKVVWSCISMALDDFYATNTNYRTRLVLHSRDSHGDKVEAALAAIDLLQNVEVQAIIGPQKSIQADFVIELGHKEEVPIISFATSPSLSSRTRYFIRAAQNDSTQTKAITAIIQGFKWREVIAIYEDSDYGNGLIPYLIDSCQEIQTRITYRSVISLSITDDQIHAELYKLMAMPTRVFVVHMTSSLASRFLVKVKEVGMMSNGYAWIITDGLMEVLDSMDTSVIASMQGALGVKPFIKPSTELDHFIPRWKRKFRKENPYIDRVELNIFGLWAYDTVWALAMAAEKIAGTKSPNNKLKTANNVTISASRNGRKLLEAVLKTRFNGLSGDFHFVNGQLESRIFQILNVIGKGDREIGFWTPGCGISRELNTSCDQMSTTSVTNLKGIIWPGELMVVPKGWVVPTNGKKLRIGVPVKGGFSEFLRVDRDPDTNRTSTSGYIIDFFNTVMEELPYPVSYDFVPFQKDDGSSSGNYNDMVYQVYLQRYDAVVGDTTITGNRSLYVDFTLPYTEGGVSMMVPIKYEDRTNAWIFLKPLSKDLWLTIGAFFILTGFVIWVLEHRINNDFRGPPSQHVGMILWFSFSTMVFAHRENVVRNLTRFVVIVWIFVVLILNSSYTASLSSMLTVQNLQPSVTGIEELKKNGDNVGYQQGSFIPDLLKFLDFDESKLIPFNSLEDLIEALGNGSRNGGIAAFFDVMPYIKLFVAKYCDKYTMVGPIHKTEGFGFVFPKGSPLVGDISRSILNLTEGGKFMEIDRAWSELQTTCLDPRNSVISSSLDLKSFRGLFIITGTVSGFTLLVFLVTFLYKHRHVLTAPDSEDTFRLRFKNMLKQFDTKDLSSYHFKKDIERGQSVEANDFEVSSSINSIEVSSSINSIPTYTSGSFSLSDVDSIDFEDSIPNSPPIQEMNDVRLSD